MAGRAEPHRGGQASVQFKVYVDPGIAAAFKSKCLKDGVSMSGRISGLMAGAGLEKPSAMDATGTRRQRRRAVKAIAEKLGAVIAAEADYMNAIPENLQGSSVSGRAEETIEALEEALALLGEAY